MSKRTIYGLMAVAVLVAGLSGAATAYTMHADNLVEARILSARHGKPLLIEIFHPKCGACEAFARAEKNDPAVSAALGGVILLRVDATGEAGRQIMQLYPAAGYPSFVVTSSEGDVIQRWSGFDDVQGWRSILGGAVVDRTTLAERRQRFERGPTSADALVLARAADAEGNDVRSVRYYHCLQQLDRPHADDYALSLFEAVARGALDMQYTLGHAAASADAVLARPDCTAAEAMTVATAMKRVAAALDEPEGMVPYLEAAMEASAGSDDPLVRERRRFLLVDHALFVEKDAKKALAYHRETLPEGWREDARLLNNFAWWCFENRVNLEEAEQLARQAIELTEDPRARANVLDTVAEICNARGDCHEAVDLITEAIELDPRNEYLRRQLTKFRTAVTSAGY